MALPPQVGGITKTIDLPPVKASTLRSTLTRFDIDLDQEVRACLGAAAWVLLLGCCLDAAAWVLPTWGCSACCLGAAYGPRRCQASCISHTGGCELPTRR